MHNLIFLDLETTGLDTSSCEVIEAAYYTEGNYPTVLDRQRSSLFKPSIPIAPDISGITNIDNDMVKDCEPFLDSQLWKNLKAMADDGYIAVCHNTDFDLAVLESHGIKFEESFCTLKLAKLLLPLLNNHKLGTLRAAFNITTTGESHRAGYDVKILIKVFYALVNQEITACNDQRLSDFDLSLILQKNREADLAFYATWQFGKYKGEKLKISQTGYIMWALNTPSLQLHPKFVENCRNILKS
jgi:DNA polymerase III alpha subunit (gram-positive type)